MNGEGKPPRLREQVRRAIRTRCYSRRTEKTYWYWIRYFIRFHDLRHPADLAEPEVRGFLTWLATARDVAVATQNRALNALVFLYARVLERPLGDIAAVTRPRRPARLPVVLTHDEANAVLGRLAGVYRTMAGLMYGAGPRVTECARLRINDLDFPRRMITVRDGKGAKDRTTLLPEPLVDGLHGRVEAVRARRRSTPAEARIPVSQAFALARKYPDAPTSLAWQWLLPANGPCQDDDERVVRHHVHTSSVQKAVKAAVRDAGIGKPAGCHTLRHRFATELRRRGTDIRTVQELLGHAAVKTTRIYTHVLGTGFAGVASPLR